MSGAAPARLDLCGGWTDTPPYALEFGGSVLNAAVNLNGQAPIQVFARVIPQRLIRITSIDRGTRLEISRLEELQDYRDLDSESSLVKAALVLSGLSGREATLAEQLSALFGGGIELTTLAAIPKGSGLGTSSILGGVLLAVLDRVLGRTANAKGLFHRVLRLEQALTTGGGWQDQIGGDRGRRQAHHHRGRRRARSGHPIRAGRRAGSPRERRADAPLLHGPNAAGQEYFAARGGALPGPRPRYAPRLARVACLDAAGGGGHGPPRHAGLGRLRRRRLATQQAARSRVEQCGDRGPFGGSAHIYGAKLLGAGGGGFLFLVCKSPPDAAAVREMLDRDPPNVRARFFQFNVNREGLRITAC